LSHCYVFKPFLKFLLQRSTSIVSVAHYYAHREDASCCCRHQPLCKCGIEQVIEICTETTSLQV